MFQTRAARSNFPRGRCVVLATLLMFVTFGTESGSAQHAADANDPGERVIDPAKRVEFRLHDGVRISGTLSTWDNDGFNGSFGRRAWTELHPDDTWKLYLTIADRESAHDWINLGRIMLLMPEGKPRALQAFRRALAIDPSLAGEVMLANEAVEKEKSEREAEQETLENAKLRTVSPDAGPWTSDAWPMLSPEQRAAVTAALKARAAEIFENAGMSVSPVETDLIVMYSDAPRTEAAMWVIRLERAYKRLARLFEIHSSQNIFYGKAVVFVFTDPDRYRLVEAEVFNQLVPEAASGLTHYDGPSVFLCFRQHSDPDALLWQMIHEFTHAFMHRLHSPARLPAWANEGLAHVIASQEMEGTLLEKDRRADGLEYIRSGASVIELLDRAYVQFDWTEAWTRFVDVSGLVVELMMRDRPREFLNWVRAVKKGMQWREALAEAFGIEPREIIDAAARHYMVND